MKHNLTGFIHWNGKRIFLMLHYVKVFCSKLVNLDKWFRVMKICRGTSVACIWNMEMSNSWQIIGMLTLHTHKHRLNKFCLFIIEALIVSSYCQFQHLVVFVEMVSKSSDFATVEKKIQSANRVNIFFLQQKINPKYSPAPSKILLPSLHESICPFIPHVGNKISPCYPAAWWPRPAGCTRGSLSAMPGDGKKAQKSEGLQNRDDKNKSSMYRGNGQTR